MRIAVTRLKGKGDEDVARCAKYGHECYSVSPLAAELHYDLIRKFAESVNRGEFDCLFFTSALPASFIGPLLRSWPRIISIGPQTAKVLGRFGIESEVLPAFYSRDFVPYLGEWIKGRRIGIPRADVPNPDLLDAITRSGGYAEEYRCYSLVPTGEALRLQGADAILFTSAQSFKTAIWEQPPDLLIMAIGEITASVMRKGGVTPVVVGDGSLEGTLRKMNQFLYG